MSQILLLWTMFAISKAYVRVTSQMTQPSGENICLEHESHLAIITENSQLANGKSICADNDLESALGCWIGLYYDGSIWRWRGTSNLGTYGFNGQVPTNDVNNRPWKEVPAENPASQTCVILDKSDTADSNYFRWITADCSASNVYPLCNLRRHIFRSSQAECDNANAPPGGCSIYNKDYWKKKSALLGFKEPVYLTNGVVTALIGELEWQGAGAMGTGNNVILTIDDKDDRPYFPLEFSVTNNQGINCVIGVDSEDPGDVKIISWSVPIVYINPEDYLESWYVWNVKEIATKGQTAEIFMKINDDNPPCSGDCQTLSAYSWVEFDGIVWVNQGSGLNTIVADSTSSIFITPIEVPDKNVKINVPIDEPEAKFVKSNFYDSKDNSFYVMVIIIMTGCAVFGLFVGVGLKWIELRMRTQYYTKLVNETEESS